MDEKIQILFSNLIEFRQLNYIHRYFYLVAKHVRKKREEGESEITTEGIE